MNDKQLIPTKQNLNVSSFKKKLSTNLEILPEFEEDLCDYILSNSLRKTYSIGEVIISQGILNSQTGIILSGLLKVHSDEDNSLLLYHIYPTYNPIINLMNMTNKTRTHFSITTLEKSTILWISNSKILELENRFKSFKKAIISSNELTINSLMNIYTDLIVMTTKERLLNYLKVKAMVYKSKTLSISRIEIASDLNLSISTISRTIKQLDANNKIIRKPNSIVLID